MINENKAKIILSGGGTGGSVTPLLAIVTELVKEERNLEFIFIGSDYGPEKELVFEFSKRIPLKFVAIPAGKWRRYFSLGNLVDFFRIIVALFVSFKILNKEKPDLIMTAGSFVSVPLVWAGSILKIPVLVHQQDIRPGLANKLMAPFARAITITFEKSFTDYGPRAIWTGNPTVENNDNVLSRSEVFRKYNLIADVPMILVVGGGTGSLAINNFITDLLTDLTGFCQVVHLTGKGKMKEGVVSNSRYRSFELLSHEEMMLLMSAADLVISRCGLGALTALAYLRKPSILIPMPDSHQEDNAAVLFEAEAALVMSQKNLLTQELLVEINNLLNDKNRLQTYSRNIGHIMKARASENIAALVWEIIGAKGISKTHD